MVSSLYDTDLRVWAKQQADFLRSHQFDRLDLTHLVGEVDDLGKAIEFNLRSSYKVIAINLLKKSLQPGDRTESWFNEISRARWTIKDLIGDFPGLKLSRQAVFERAYPMAGKLAAEEIGLSQEMVPADPPFTREQVENETFWG